MSWRATRVAHRLESVSRILSIHCAYHHTLASAWQNYLCGRGTYRPQCFKHCGRSGLDTESAIYRQQFATRSKIFIYTTTLIFWTHHALILIYLVVGELVGLLAGLFGVGGVLVPFLTVCGLPMINAVGASAAMGFPIALAGTIGFIYNGWGHVALPDYSLGFVYLPALAGLVVASVLITPYGVKLSHSLPVKTLKRCFVFFLIVMVARMAYTLL